MGFPCLRIGLAEIEGTCNLVIAHYPYAGTPCPWTAGVLGARVSIVTVHWLVPACAGFGIVPRLCAGVVVAGVYNTETPIGGVAVI